MEWLHSRLNIDEESDQRRKAIRTVEQGARVVRGPAAGPRPTALTLGSTECRGYRQADNWAALLSLGEESRT